MQDAQPAPFQMPGLDIAAARVLWPDEASYRRYLTIFVHEYAALAQDANAFKLAADLNFVHRIGGTAVNLVLPEVARSARALEASLSDPRRGPPYALLDELLGALRVGLASATAFLAASAAAAPARDSQVSSEQIRRVLQDLLEVLPTDNPESAEPLVALLQSYLGMPATAALHDAVTAFRFAQAQQETLRLMQQVRP